jgi:3-hydroxyisobutyrate dehydrogenase
LVQNAVAGCNRIITNECVAAACKNGVTLAELIDPIRQGAGWNGGAERIIPALRTDSATTDFQMSLAMKDLRLGAQIGMDVGAPMMMANVVRGVFEITANELGGGSNLDDSGKIIAHMSGITFSECAGP